MNIVKLKDQIKPDDNFFNTYLKGKYAWWIHMRYIVPFDLMGVNGYIACEEDINDLFKPPFMAEFRDTYDQAMWPYIDEEATDAANQWNLYKTKNKYSTDPNITIDKVKLFRSWLATTILTFDMDSKGNQMHDELTVDQTWVLQYYANGMYDEVVKRLSLVGKKVLYDTNKSTCGCNNSTYLNLNVDTCDPLAAYKESIYNQMVDMFSEIEFWMKWDADFLKEFKKYIDNIVNLDLKLDYTEYVDVYADCTCMDNENTNIDILKRLKVALDYMINGKVAGHKNYISDALKDWASILYEKMQW